MDFKIKNKRDGSFVCRLANGRKVDGMYGYDPATRLPRVLSLSIITRDHFGNPKAVMVEYNVTGYLDDSDLRESAETLARRADALEHGIPSAPSVVKIDLTTSRQ